MAKLELLQTGFKMPPRTVVLTSELKGYLSNLSDKDTVSLIRFTDKIQGVYTYAGYKASVQAVIDSLRLVPRGNTDFSVALNEIDAIPNNHRVIILTDGLNNSGSADEIVCNRLSALASRLNSDIYFLLLNESDLNNPIIQFASKADNMRVVKSLSDIPHLAADSMKSKAQDIVEVPQSSAKASTRQLGAENKSSRAFDWSRLIRVLIAFALLAIVLFIEYFICKTGVLYAFSSKSSIEAFQKAIWFPYKLTKNQFDFILKTLPSNVKDYFIKNMPSYENLKRGNVLPQNERQAKTLDEIRKETGKHLKYKNGEPDFSPVAKAKVKLKGGLDKHIPKDSDPRANVGRAQEDALEQLLKTKRGEKDDCKICKEITKGFNPSFTLKKIFA